MNRIYTIPNKSPLLGAVTSVGLGLGVSWVFWGGIFFVVPTLCFLANAVRVWATWPSIQFGDDALHLITRLYTKKIPYARFAPYLDEMVPGVRGCRVYYRSRWGQKRSVVLRDFLVGKFEVKSWEILHQRLRCLCGVAPAKDPKKRAEAQSPDINPEALFALAREFSEEVLTNPVLPLFALEDPSFCAELIFEAKQGRVTECFQRATERERYLLLTGSIQWLSKRGVAIHQDYLGLSEAIAHFTEGKLSQRELEKRQEQTRTRPTTSGETYALDIAIENFYHEPDRALMILSTLCLRKDPLLCRDLVDWQYETLTSNNPS